jgi:sulfite exporter TauE/SafE
MIDASAIALGGALIAGLSGSAHCFGMCGGMAGALGMHARSVSQSETSVWRAALLYQFGRIGGYTLIGALFGVIGMALAMTLNLDRIANIMRAFSGALLLLIGMRMLLRFNALASLEQFGAAMWRRIQPLAGRAASANAFARPILLGLLWGWLPCGLVYSISMMAATSGSPMNGAALMLAFGAGTLPAMLTSTLAAARIQRILANRNTRIASGALLLLFGSWLLLSSVTMASHAHHHG